MGTMRRFKMVDFEKIPGAGRTIHLLKLWNAATEETRAKDWYQDAYIEAAVAARDLQMPVEQFAAIVAAISPMKFWNKNIEDAALVVEFQRAGGLNAPIPGVGGLHKNNNKGIAIAAGEPIPVHLSGPKVVAFYESILGVCTDPVIDTHAFWSWVGVRNRGSVKFPLGLRKRAEESYRELADVLDMPIWHIQAVIWETRKRLLAEKDYSLFLPDMAYIS